MKKRVLINNNNFIDIENEINRLNQKNDLNLNKRLRKFFQQRIQYLESNSKPLIEIEFKGDYNPEIESLFPKFNILSDRVEKYYECKKDINKIENKIKDNQNFLQDTDYIIIKIYEAKILMLDIPYSQEYIEEICNKRQEARDKINELKKLLQDV